MAWQRARTSPPHSLCTDANFCFRWGGERGRLYTGYRLNDRQERNWALKKEVLPDITEAVYADVNNSANLSKLRATPILSLYLTLEGSFSPHRCALIRQHCALCKPLGSSTQGSFSSCFRATRDFFVPVFFFFSRWVFCDMTCDRGWTLVARSLIVMPYIGWKTVDMVVWQECCFWGSITCNSSHFVYAILLFLRFIEIYKAYSVGSDCRNKMAHSSGRCERVDYVALYNLSSVNLKPPLKKGNNN